MSDYSDDEDYKELPRKKNRIDLIPESSSSSSEEEEERNYPKSPFTDNCLIGLALANLDAETGSTLQIQNFIIQHFPYYGTLFETSWKNKRQMMTGNRAHPCFHHTGRRDERKIVLTLHRTEFTDLKRQILVIAREQRDEVILSMKNPDELDALLEAVNEGEAIEKVQEAEEGDDMTKPRCSTRNLIEEAFEDQRDGLTVVGICTRIEKKYPFYKKTTESSKFYNMVGAKLYRMPYFYVNGKLGNANLHYINDDLKGLPTPGRIRQVGFLSMFRSPLGHLIAKSEKLGLYGNPSEISARFVFEGEEDDQEEFIVEDEDDDEEVEENDKPIFGEVMKRIDVVFDNKPGKYKEYLGYMSCIKPSECPFGPNCFKYIFGDSAQKYPVVAQTANSEHVLRALNNHLKFLEKRKLLDLVASNPESPPQDLLPKSPQGEGPSDPPEESEILVKKSCKDLLVFLLHHKNHEEFRPENCLALETTNKKEIRKKIKLARRNIFQDISMAKGLTPYFTPRALTQIESLYPILKFRPEYVKQQQLMGRLFNVPQEPKKPSPHSHVVKMTQQEKETLINTG